MKFDPSSRLARSCFAAGGVLASGLLLAGTIAPADAPRHGPQVFRGRGCLPLSGDLAAAGDAFRRGFQEGIQAESDTTLSWQWSWADNGSDPLVAQAWIDSASRTGDPDALLAGLGSATDGLQVSAGRGDSVQIGMEWSDRRRPVPLLLLGDGSTTSDRIWHLWPTAAREREAILELLRTAEPPVAVVMAASGSWAEIVFGGLRDSLPGLSILPHDLDNGKWDGEIKRFWEIRPRTVLFWDRPHEASALLALPLARVALRSAQLLVPEGTVVPDSLRAVVLAPAWQPASPPDSAQCRRYLAWGREVGRSLVRAARLSVADSVADLLHGLRKLPPDSARRVSWPQGWSPVFSVHPSVSDSLKSASGH